MGWTRPAEQRRPKWSANVYSTGWLVNREGEYVPTDRLSTTFAALADPTRRAILAQLRDGEATVNELADPFPISVQAVSKHLGVLERAGLIERGRSAQLRPSRLRATRLKDAAEWLETYRRFWEGSFERLDQRLRVSEDRAEDD
jgi:DNA-binding transcriptional ArsR family regulator